jgi:16S rRNA (adenine1518-N6/adenine1519-N6)-dimethyltransferase
MGTLYEEARAAFQTFELKPKKRLGQNFLIHERVIGAILGLLDLTSQDQVLEIGPGLGFLTRRLVEKVNQVYAVEVDPTLVEWLKRSSWAAHPGFRLIHDDILKAPLGEILPRHKIKLVGNLPYSISTPVLFRLFEWREHFASLVLMVQKEVADRIAGKPGTKAYGTLSVWCQLHGRISERIQVAPEAFFPRPKVRSTVLKLDLYSEPMASGEDLARLRGLVRAAFGQRRKMLANNLALWLKRDREEIKAFLRAEQIDPGRRGETLSVDEFVRLAGALKRNELSIGAGEHRDEL